MAPLKRHWFRLLLTIIGVTCLLAFSLKTKRSETPDRFALKAPLMCAPINMLKTEFGDMLSPLAPRLPINWEHSFPITTKSAEAQRFFNQGLFYTYAFNHAEAERSFKEAIRLDQDCAMCYWGVALSLGPNINRPMQEAHMEDAYRFSQRAMELRAATSSKEQVLIGALAKRYAQEPPENRSELDIAYANAMRIVAHRYREDVDVLTLFAEALMDTMPWDYWEKDGTPKPATQEMHATLDYVLEKNPEHPGANHYYIHSVEAIQPELAEGCADKLQELRYNAGHLVHMPSHIYIRRGRYEDANIANKRAIELDEDYIAACQAQGFYPALYYPHNVHFLWFGASMTGQSELAIEAARKTAAKSDFERYQTIPLYALVRFGKWADILQEPKPTEELHYTTTIWHFARGMAFAKTGKLNEAKKELKLVEKHKDSPKMAELDNAFFPSLGMSAIAHHLLAGEIAGREKDLAKKIEHLRQAVDIQDGFTYMEPPYFFYQVRQSLGAALLEARQPKEAEAVYRAELAKFPNNGWSLYGLYQSLEAQGKTSEAQEILEQFEQAWRNADVKLTASVF